MADSASRLVLTITFAILAIGIAWIMFSSGAAAAPEIEPDGPRIRSDLPTNELATHTATGPVVAADLQREVVELPGAGLNVVAELVIRVVDVDDRPTPGAEVGFYFTRKIGDAANSEVSERIAWAGDIWTADDRGEVRVPGTGALAWTVFGRYEGRWGVKYVRVADVGEVQVLKLRRDITIRAAVLDPSGRPAIGVDVALGDEGGVDAFEMGPVATTTAPDGIATFRHVQQVIQPAWGSDGAVMLAFPLGQSVFEKVDLTAAEHAPYVLRMPGTGSVEVTLTTKTGEPRTEFAKDLPARVVEVQGSRQRVYRRHFGGGKLLLPHVGLGLHFRVLLRSAGASGTIEFDGPTRWDERVEIELEIETRPTLSGRLVDESGVPQKGFWFATHMTSLRGQWNEYFETGDDGRFVSPIPELPGVATASRCVLFRRTVPDAGMQARIDLRALGLHEGRNEIGDVVLAPPSLMLEGKVVDDVGAAVVGAQLELYQGDPADEVWQLPGRDGYLDKTDARGRFRINAFHAGGELLVRASIGGNGGPFVPFAAGTEGFTYVLPRVGTAEMAVTFRATLAADDLLFVSQEKATGKVRSQVGHYVFKDGVARWQGLRPGRYDFGVRVVGTVDMLVTLPDIEIRGGETTTLPAQAFDDELHALTIRITDTAGVAVEGATIVVDPSGLAGQPRTALRAKLGERRLLTPRVPVDLLVFAPGYRKQLVRWVSRDTTVQLLAGLEVEMRVKLPEGFPAATDQLFPRIREYDASDPDPDPHDSGHDLFVRGGGRMFYASLHPWLWDQKLPLGRDGRVVVRVPAAGDYAVEWVVRGKNHRDLPVASRRIFTVTESDTRTRVEIELTSEQVR